MRLPPPTLPIFVHGTGVFTGVVIDTSTDEFATAGETADTAMLDRSGGASVEPGAAGHRHSTARYGQDRPEERPVLDRARLRRP